MAEERDRRSPTDRSAHFHDPFRLRRGRGPVKRGHAERSTWAAALAWYLTVVGVYTLNGIADQVEDAANGSTRPIATGRLSVTDARVAVASCFVLSLGLTAGVSLQLAGLTLFMIIGGVLYSGGRWPWKNHWLGAGVCCVSSGLVTYAAGATSVGGLPSPGIAVVMVVASLWMGIAGASKDMADAYGDALAGRRTLPVILGDRRARGVIATLAALVGGVVATLIWWFPVIPILPGMTLVCGSLAMAVPLLSSAQKGLPYAVFMCSQFAVNLTLLLPF